MGFGWKNLYYIVGVVYGTVVLLKRGGGGGVRGYDQELFNLE
jgi:hypothetical protein